MTPALRDAVTIPQLVLAAAEAYGDDAAIVDEAGHALSFRDVAVLASQAAGAFLAEGCVVGARVAIWAPNSAAWIIGALGLQMAGGVLAPMDPRVRAQAGIDVLQRSGAQVLLTDNERLGAELYPLVAFDRLPALRRIVALPGATDCGDWVGFLAGGSAGATALHERICGLEDRHACDLLLDGDVQGGWQPQPGVHGQIIRSSRAYSAGLGLRRGDRCLVAEPLFKPFGYRALVPACLLCGLTIYPHALATPDALMAGVAESRITVLAAPLGFFRQLAAAPDGAYDLSCLRMGLAGELNAPLELSQGTKPNLGFERMLAAGGAEAA